MASRILRTLLVISCLVGLTGSAGWSHAADARPGERVVKDASFDVQQEEVPYTGDHLPAPGRTTGDITRLSLRHGQDRVRVQIKAQELILMGTDLPGGRKYVSTHISLRTNEAEYGATLHMSSRSSFEFFDREAGIVPCPGVRHTFDVTRDTVTFSVPRECLAQPRWVGVHAHMTYRRGESGMFLDVAPDNPDARNFEPAAFTQRAWHQGP